MIDITIDSEELPHLGIVDANSPQKKPVTFVYVDKKGPVGRQIIPYVHQAEKPWVCHLINGRGLSRKFTRKKQLEMSERKQ